MVTVEGMMSVVCKVRCSDQYCVNMNCEFIAQETFTNIILQQDFQ